MLRDSVIFLLLLKLLFCHCRIHELVIEVWNTLIKGIINKMIFVE